MEQVVIRRRRYELRDLIHNRIYSPQGPISRISSGSQAEGLSLPGSDLDDMFVYNNISVLCSDYLSVSESDIIMDTTDIKPGFVQLFCRDSRFCDRLVSSAVTESENGLVLSSLLFRDAVVDQTRTLVPSAVGHGPCSTIALPFTMEEDVLLCFLCKTWPVLANEWTDRHRNNNWPLHDLITNIVHDGCLIVPIGNPHSQESYLQWRISFSTAEKKLVHSMNHSQFLCYGLLKLFLKHVINSNTDVKDLLCSYFLKTSLFYCMEDEQIVWNKDNFLDCFWICIRRIIKWVRDEYCPNYFIKDNNMFEGKVCGEKGRILLSELYQEGLYSLFRIPCLSGLHIATMNRPVLTGGMLTDAEREYFCDREIFREIFYNHPEDVNKCIRLLVVNAEMIETSTNNIDKLILTLNYYYAINYYAYIDGMCGKGLTLNQKLAFDVVAYYYPCRVDCKMYPSEIEQELVQHSIFNIAFINPRVYCYVLLFLPYLYTNSNNNMSNTLSELYTTVDDRTLVHESEAQLSISLLVLCIQLCESWQNNHRNR